MILGIDHLAFNTTNFYKTHSKLVSSGYKCVFIEKEILNHPEKKQFLRNFTNKHDIALYKPVNSGLTIEVTKHSYSFSKLILKTVLNNDTLIIQIPKNKMKDEMFFWLEFLKFKKINDCSLKFISIVPQWSCQINFKAVENSTDDFFLDDIGYTCLAIITNNIEQDFEKIRIQQIKNISSIFNLKVNKQQLLIGLFRTPLGFICEFIQIVK